MKKILIKLAYKFTNLFLQRVHGLSAASFDLALINMYNQEIKNSKNPFNQFGAKYFSQNEEDGLIEEIFKRINIQSGIFLEFGVGDGLENNSIALLAKSWRGVWLSGQPLAFSKGDLKSKNLIFKKCWITRESIVSQANECLSLLGDNGKYNMISVDLDGVDIYVLKKLLENNFRPELFVLEYNARFPASVDWSVEYSPDFVWDGSDYFGSSLKAFANLLDSYGYFLVCCSVTGTNAFFVKKEFRNLFQEVPNEIENIYMPPKYYLFENHGHKVSPLTVKSLIKN
jgi:hypothetical protein